MKKHKIIDIVDTGICKCIKEPKCKAGMEGYDESSLYKFQKCTATAPSGNSTSWYRVWHSERYYETCRPTTFNDHFLRVE